jgi:hypothetical protein
VAPLQEAHDGERARAEVDAAVRVDEVELRAGHGDEGLLGGGSGGVVSSSSSAFGKRFSASSSGSTVGYSKDEAVAAGAARKTVLGSGGRRRSGMRRAHTDAGRRARWVRGS